MKKITENQTDFWPKSVMKKVYCLTLQPYPNMQPVKDQVNQDKYRLVRAIAKCQRAKILPIRVRCSICLEISRITVIWNFLLFFSLKMIRNSSGQVRQLYAYVANESTRRLVEDGMSTELTNTHTARGFSALYHVLARKQRILCSALRDKRYLTLPYVTWL